MPPASTVTSSGIESTGRPCRVRRCWKSTPFDTATQGVPRPLAAALRLVVERLRRGARHARHLEIRRLAVEGPDQTPLLLDRIGEDARGRRDLVAGRDMGAGTR